LSIHALVAKIYLVAEQSCAMVRRFFASCIFREPRAGHFRHAF